MNVTAALERMEIETAASTSSVRVSTEFAREFSYSDAIDGDVVHVTAVVTSPAIMAAVC